MKIPLMILCVFFASSPFSSFAHETRCDCPGEAKTASSTITSTGEGGFISLDSEPRGAEVYVDSEYKGTTPLQNLRVASGSVPLSLVKDGFLRQGLKLAMKSGERRDLGTIKLTNMYGQVYVNTMPPRATVTFDGERFKARTPLTIRRISRDKTHVLRIELDGYRSWERTVDLEDKDKTKYDVQLEKVQ